MNLNFDRFASVISGAQKINPRHHIPLTIDYGEVAGRVPVRVAEYLHAAYELRRQKIITFLPGRMVLGLGARSAEEMNGHLKQVTDFLDKRGLITLSKEKMRVACRHDDGDWSILRNHIPVAERHALWAMGVEHDVAHCIAYKHHRDGLYFVFGKRRPHGLSKWSGEVEERLDPFASGGVPARFTRLEAMLDEIVKETGLDPREAPADWPRPRLYGTVNTALPYKNTMLFARRAAVFGWPIPPGWEPKPSEAFSSHVEVNALDFVADLERPDWQKKYMPYTPTSTIYFLTQYLLSLRTANANGELVSVMPDDFCKGLECIAELARNPGYVLEGTFSGNTGMLRKPAHRAPRAGLS